MVMMSCLAASALARARQLQTGGGAGWVPSALQLAAAGHARPGKEHRNLTKKARRALRAEGQWHAGLLDV
jgi:hypothetical protein